MQKKSVSRIVFLKNVLSECCARVIELELEKAGVKAKSIRLGQVKITYDPEYISYERITILLENLGFEMIQHREEKLVDEIKAAIINLVHHSTYNAMIKNSDFLVGKFGMSYQHLSNIFKKHERITLERYIILQKIEKVKELLENDEMTLSEIAFVMGYSSVQYLSTQFKTISGYSVTDYRKKPSGRQDIHNLDIYY